MNRLVPVNSVSDIPKIYRKSPIGLLLAYHNLNHPFKIYTQAQLLIGMCMDSRKHLHIPDNFAFILRAGGANLRYSEFKVSYAISVGGVREIALIGHNHCGMVDLEERKSQFVQGLVRHAGWKKKEAEEHFHNFAMMFEVGNAADFILSEAKRLHSRYPKIPVCPMFYKVEENRIYLLND